MIYIDPKLVTPQVLETYLKYLNQKREHYRRMEAEAPTGSMSEVHFRALSYGIMHAMVALEDAIADIRYGVKR